MEIGRIFSMSGINSGRWNRTMLNLCGIVTAILKMVTGRNFSMSGINSGHHNLPTYEMSLKSDNVEFVVAILKMATGRNFLMSGINLGHHYLPTMKWLWNRTMLNLCGIVTAILNFSMSGHHYLPTYQILMISDNVEFLPPIFLYRVLAAISKILKTQNCSSNGDLSLCQILCLYHYSFRSYQH